MSEKPIEAAFRAALYGCVDEQTAFVVADYPYGYNQRTVIRYWVDRHPRRGSRCVSQTRNPKTGRWNQPRRGTYSEWGAELWLDGIGHVHCQGLGPYSRVDEFELFFERFPQSVERGKLAVVVAAKIRNLEQTISGEAYWTINGERQSYSEHQQSEDRVELARWESIARAHFGYAAKPEGRCDDQ